MDEKGMVYMYVYIFHERKSFFAELFVFVHHFRKIGVCLVLR